MSDGLRERDAVLAALTDEDEIAHGEAWDDARKRGVGVCAYCGDDWPCRTQRGIDRLIAALSAPAAPLDVERLRRAITAYRESLPLTRAVGGDRYGPGRIIPSISEYMADALAAAYAQEQP